MKKTVVYLAFIFILTPLISAQDFLGEISDQTLLILSPLILIAAGLIFFLALYIKDNYHKFSRIFPKRREVAALKERIPVDYLAEFKKFRTRMHKAAPDEALRELSGLAKGFFVEKLGLEHEREFTTGELEAELKKEKQEWADFVKRLTNIRYSGNVIAKDDVEALAAEFYSIVKHYKVKREEPKEGVLTRFKKEWTGLEHSVLDRLKQFFKREPVHIPKEKPHVVLDIKKVFGHKGRLPGPVRNLLRLEEALKRKEHEAIARLWQNLTRILTSKQAFSNILGNVKHKRDMSSFMRACLHGFKTRDVSTAKRFYSKALEHYYFLPLDMQERVGAKLSELNKRIEQLELVHEKEELEYISEKMTAISKGKVLQLDKGIYNDIRIIATYAQKITSFGRYGILVGKEHLAKQLDALLAKIEVFEKKQRHRLTGAEKEVLEGIKGVAAKRPVFLQPTIEGFDVPVLKKSALSVYAKEVIAYIEYLEFMGAYRLLPAGRRLIRNLNNFLKGRSLLRRHEAELLSRFGKAVYKEEEPFAILKEMQDSGLMIAKEPLPTIRRLVRIRLPEVKPMKEPSPILRRLPGIRTREMGTLKREEGMVLEKLKHIAHARIEKQPRAVKHLRRRVIAKYAWQETVEKIRKQRIRQFDILSKEEKSVISKLHDLDKFS